MALPGLLCFAPWVTWLNNWVGLATLLIVLLTPPLLLNLRRRLLPLFGGAGGRRRRRRRRGDSDSDDDDNTTTWSVRRYRRYDVALARFRAAFPNAPEDEFIALVHDTAECYGMSEEEVVGEISGRRQLYFDDDGHWSTDAMGTEYLAQRAFRAAIKNLKKNAKFVFQVRREDETLETTQAPIFHSIHDAEKERRWRGQIAAMLDKCSLIDGTIGDYASRPEGNHDPRITPDPSANFVLKNKFLLSRVAYEYAPGRLDEFHSAVHRAASHHGVAVERIVLVLTTPFYISHLPWHILVYTRG